MNTVGPGDGVAAGSDPFARPVLPQIRKNPSQAGTSPNASKAVTSTFSKPLIIGLSIIFVAVVTIVVIVVVTTVVTRPSSTEVDTTCVGATAESCNSSLAQNLQFIVAQCEADVGICSGEVCDECGKCCGPIFERVTATCDSGIVPFSRVVGCTCQACDSLELAISGRVTGECSDASNCTMSMRVGGTEMTVSDVNGYFTFPTAYPSDQRIVITAVDSTGQYDTRTMVLQVSRESQSYMNVEVIVQASPAPIKFDSANGTSLNLGANESVTLDILPGSVYDENGNVFDGEVDLTLSFVDTADDSAISQINGELTIRVDGVDTPFSSYGMIAAGVSSQGRALTARGVNLQLVTDEIPDSVNPEDVLVWKLSETGDWEPLSRSRLVPDTRVRNGRRATMRSVISASLDLSSARAIWNLDRLVGSYCLMRVRIFENEQATRSGTLFSVTVKAYYRTAAGKWVNFIKRISRSNGVCLNVPCDRTGWTEVDKVYVTVPGYKVYEPYGISSETLTTVAYTPSGTDGFEITVPQHGSIPLTSGGPFYAKYTYDCYVSDNFEEEGYFRFIRSFTEENSSGSGDDDIPVTDGGDAVTSTSAAQAGTGSGNGI